MFEPNMLLAAMNNEDSNNHNYNHEVNNNNNEGFLRDDEFDSANTKSGKSCTDPTASFVIYAPVDIVAMNIVLNGGDPDYVALLPSGFAILPDGNANGRGEGGSLLTVAFQILVDSVPTAKLSLGSVATVNNLIACTVERIKASMSCETA
ncbi:hypothetical protein BRARA_I05464 [Brassica rapa]|uniref:HD-Zip IV C-terminal domain-containing protein n=1 Tax=Brassica campestris TaxID=3711 RepID=A0A397YGF3_BRACM|nr:hypothetical protein BRARA_I05464 [Brassica rapa]